MGGTAEVTNPTATARGSTILVLTTPQTPGLTGQGQSPGVTHFVSTPETQITEQETSLIQDESTSSTPVTLTQESKPQTIEGQNNDTNESMIQYCETFLTLHASDSPDPAVAGDLITYTLTFTNSGNSMTAADVTLKNILPAGVTFVAASEGGTESGGVVIWYLGDIPPGTVEGRTVVAQVDPFVASGNILTNNTASLENDEGTCAWTNEFTTLQAVSNEAAGLPLVSDESIVLEEVSDVDDDADGFANHYEAQCGSDPLDPSSTCFTLHLDQTFVTVQRGSEATIIASVERNFTFTGPVSFSTADDINVDLWIVPDLSTVLSNTNESVSTPITIQTTNETPFGLHEKTIIATSGGMTSQKTFTLEVIE